MIHCSFCGKSNTEVAVIVAGPNVYICNECNALTSEIVAEQTLSADERTEQAALLAVLPHLERLAEANREKEDRSVQRAVFVVRDRLTALGPKPLSDAPLGAPPCYFVSGHLDLTEAEFAAHYEPALRAAIAEGASFVVGDARGADLMVQRFLNLHVRPKSRVTVFHMLDTPRNNIATPASQLRGGYESDTARDEAMTAASTADIAWVRPGRETSGTAKNLARRKRGVVLPLPPHHPARAVLVKAIQALTSERGAGGSPGPIEQAVAHVSALLDPATWPWENVDGCRARLTRANEAMVALCVLMGARTKALREGATLYLGDSFEP